MYVMCYSHISKDTKDHSGSDHRKQFNNVIKTLFCGLTEYKIILPKT